MMRTRPALLYDEATRHHVEAAFPGATAGGKVTAISSGIGFWATVLPSKRRGIVHPLVRKAESVLAPRPNAGERRSHAGYSPLFKRWPQTLRRGGGQPAAVQRARTPNAPGMTEQKFAFSLAKCRTQQASACDLWWIHQKDLTQHGPR
jgi:hypothetical protein